MSGAPIQRVGYRNPPAETRFKKGQSGNPKGRPRKPPSAPVPLMTKLLKRQLSVTVEGRRRKMSAAEAVFLQLLEQASRGRPFAIREVVSAQRAIEAAEAEERKKSAESAGVPLVRMVVNTSEVIEILTFLGFVYIRPDGEFVFDRRLMDILLDRVGLELADLPFRPVFASPEQEAGGPTPLRADGLFAHFAELHEAGAFQSTEDDI
ncbi:MAG: DUF5681 domain-containing protein [Brevundimonas sp.]|uniref:DUF5681 domain-containing protein n=1 Tax=Brevundimonas sp. TaxID=1871086 RepID=UPI002ABAC85E|nr:DUF5681 domain-containing protein [Brevundimonas sp.]MDZ4113669.1 DUF5681 domain-containing protein [Brevundimonas sp.]